MEIRKEGGGNLKAAGKKNRKTRCLERAPLSRREIVAKGKGAGKGRRSRGRGKSAKKENHINKEGKENDMSSFYRTSNTSKRKTVRNGLA